MATKSLNNVSRFKSSILPSALKNVNVIESETVKEVEQKSLFGGGYASSILKVKTDANAIIYLVECVSWGGDAVDEDTYAFKQLKDAEYCFDSFLKPLHEVMNERQEGVLARVTRPGQNPKYIPNAKNYKGFFISERYEGDWLVPYFNLKKLLDLGLLEEAKSLNEADIKDLIGTKFEPALLKWGLNEYDVFIQSDDEYRSAETIDKKEVVFQLHNCWETGLNYYQLIGRYPKEVFDAMKLQYHIEEIEKEGNWKGWYTHDIDTVNERLNKIGWSCK